MSKINDFTFFRDKQTVLASTTPSGYTGGGATIRRLTSINIPANTFATGDVIYIHHRLQKIGTTNTMNWYYYWNTSDSLASATQLAVRSLAANLLEIPAVRRAAIITADGSGSAGSTGGTIIFSSSTGVDRDYATNVSGGPSFLGVNWTTNSYLILAASTASTDTCRSLYIRISN